MTIARAVLAIALAAFAVAYDPGAGVIILACAWGGLAAVRWMWRRAS